MNRHVILGKGPVGSTLAGRLLDAGHIVTVLSRSGGLPETLTPEALTPGHQTSGHLTSGHLTPGRLTSDVSTRHVSTRNVSTRDVSTRDVSTRDVSTRDVSTEGGGGAGVTGVAVDAADAAALSRAVQGADVIYNCANPAYHRWATDWPPVADALLAAAESSGAVLVTMSNLYGYGQVDGPITEDLPLTTTGTKGRVRVRMWQQALERHQQGRVRVTEARASDFVGPGVTAGGLLGERVVPRVLAGRGVQVLDAADVPHSWTSVADVARTLEVLGTDPRAWGRAWHVPTAGAVTSREAVAGLCRAAGRDPVAVRALPHLLVRAIGLASPLMRELEETRHQRTHPFVLDSSAAQSTFDLAPTPLEQTWADTVAWWRTRAAA